MIGIYLSFSIFIATANNMGGIMKHYYKYDNLYRLDSADGTFTGANGKTAKYGLKMGYDNMHNITRKSQHIEQFGVQFKGTLRAGYDLLYQYANNSQQIANIAEESYRVDSNFAIVPEKKESQYSYDANGNLLGIYTGTKQGDILKVTNTRTMLWDEENHLLATCDNGYLTAYWYDASGERTVKMSGDGEGVNINGVVSAGRTGTANFTAYVSPYLVVRNGGEYTKHIYMGSQRITSKVSNSGIFNTSPVKDTLQAKYNLQTATLKSRYDSLGVQYKGTEHSGSIISSSPSGVGGSLYFYHSDHLGSTSLITDISGEIVQHVEYVPFGGTFIDERRTVNSWHTPFLFSGKERDIETGLLYVSQRYQDEKYGIWYSVDQMAEKYPNISSYVYCANNPITYFDPDGRKFTSYRDTYLWGVFVIYNNFSKKTGEAFHNTLQNMRSSNKMFSKVYNQLESEQNRKYTFRSVDKTNATNKDFTGGEYNPVTDNIDLFFNNKSEYYTSQSAIFEEVFHAGQHLYYGKNYPGSLNIEIEAKVAKAFSGIKTKGGFEEFFPNMKPFLKALVKGNVSDELWGEYKVALTNFRNFVSDTYIQAKGNTPKAKKRYNRNTFQYDLPYLESLINRSLIPENGF